MMGFLSGLLLGAIVAFVGPSLLPQQMRSALAVTVLRIIGAAAVLFAIASTSFVRVPDGNLGQLFRVYGGGSLTEGRIIAANGENGQQAEIFTPGFHARFLLNVVYNVDTNAEEVNVPQGKVAILTARDGETLRRESIDVSSGPSRFLGVAPVGVEQPAVSEPDEDRVEGSGLEAGLPGQVVAVFPLARLLQERRQEEPGLR